MQAAAASEAKSQADADLQEAVDLEARIKQDLRTNSTQVRSKSVGLAHKEFLNNDKLHTSTESCAAPAGFSAQQCLVRT